MKMHIWIAVAILALASVAWAQDVETPRASEAGIGTIEEASAYESELEMAIMALEHAIPEPETKSAEESEWSFTLRFDYKSAYVVDGLFRLGDEPVFQSDFFASHKSGLWFDLWHSVGTESDPNSGFDDEIDYAAGYNFDLWHGWRADASVSYFDIYKLGLGAGDIIQPSVKFQREVSVGSLTDDLQLDGAPKLSVELDYSFARHEDDGYQLQVNLGWKHRRDTLGLNEVLSVKPFLAYDESPYGLDHCVVGGASASLSWEIGDGVNVGVTGKYADDIHRGRNRDGGQGAYGVFLEFNF